MAGTTISNHRGYTVTLGSSNFPGPLTITNTGDIDAAAGDIGLIVPAGASNPLVTNSGDILGGYGTVAGYSFSPVQPSGGQGGDGVDIAANGATLTNFNLIAGGNGGSGLLAGGGAGGYGLVISGTSTVYNEFGGTITGGVGGDGTGGFDLFGPPVYYNGGKSGAGVSMSGHATVQNAGQISGATGGPSQRRNGSDGATGVVAGPGGILTNAATGIILGGNGGIGPDGSSAGGDGVIVYNTATVTNGGGTIIGGTAANGADHGVAANGGIGVAVQTSGLFVNTTHYDAGTGTVQYAKVLGGAGGAGSSVYGVGGTGGIGVSLANGATLANSAFVYGGAGGASSYYGAAGGTGVLADGATLANSGFIYGGTAGAASYKGGTGGTGVSSDAAILKNTGIIGGGTGGSASVYYGGNGGTGISLGSSTFTNDGTVFGGTGGSAAVGGGGGTGISLDASTFINDGIVLGGNGGASDRSITLSGYPPGHSYGNPVYYVRNYGGNGGTGIALAASTFTNHGTIFGGNYGNVLGGSSGAGPTDGRNGGNGVDVSGDSSFNNSSDGTVIGGSGGSTSHDSDVAGGGNGVYLSANAYLYNAGSISGGVGGYSSATGGCGGNGLVNAGGRAQNDAHISGGAGGGASGTGGVGGAGVIEIAGSTSSGVANITGIILGGAGGDGILHGGAGGAGVSLSAVNGINYGSITGGAGGSGYYGGAGGTAAYLLSAVLLNEVDAFGGTGGSGYSTGGNGGVGVQAGSASSVINTAKIEGGTGGYSSHSLSGTGGTGIALSAGATAQNYGFISGGNGGAGGTQGHAGSGGTGVYAGPGTASAANYGTITGGAGGYSANGYHAGTGGAGVLIKAGTLFNDGTVVGGTGGTGYSYGGAGGAGVVLTGGYAFNYGIILGGIGGSTGYPTGNGGGGGDGVFLNGGTFINAGGISGGYGGQGPSYTGTFGAAVQFGVNAGTLVIDPGAVFRGDVNGNAAVADVLEFGGTAASYLSGIGTQFVNLKDLSFATGAAWTIEGNLAGLTGGETISGFAPTDTIVLDGFGATSDTYVSGIGLELSNGTTTVTLDITGNFTTNDFTVTDPPLSTTISLEVTCYAQGTRISTAAGEVPVEALKIGDRVKTLHAGMQTIKWIGGRSYAAPFANHPKVLPVRIAAGAIADHIPSRDLFVSPGHAICIDGALIHASRLVNGVSITQAETVETITYFHIELETHEVIFAEGCAAESFMGEYFREQFRNAAEFSRLYPGQSAPEHMCLPRLESGFHLEAIQRRLGARAGISAPEGATPSPLRGYIDQISKTIVSGWAQSAGTPEERVCLDIFAGSGRIGRVLANVFRQDVFVAGYGSGYHGFEFALPAGLAGPITVRRSTDQAMLAITGEAAARAA